MFGHNGILSNFDKSHIKAILFRSVTQYISQDSNTRRNTSEERTASVYCAVSESSRNLVILPPYTCRSFNVNDEIYLHTNNLNSALLHYYHLLHELSVHSSVQVRYHH